MVIFTAGINFSRKDLTSVDSIIGIGIKMKLNELTKIYITCISK